MEQTASRRRMIAFLLAAPAFSLLSVAGCGGGDAEQRTSGTLVKPLDAVEQAGEQAGKAEDANKKTKKK